MENERLLQKVAWIVKLENADPQTDEMCLDAVNEYGTLLQYVKNKTPEICVAALKQDPEAIRYCDPELVLEALEFLVYLNTKGEPV